MRALLSLLTVLLIPVSVIAGCSSPDGAQGSASASANAAKQNGTARPLLPPIPPRSVADPNPLKLASRRLEVAEGARVFAVPEMMLRDAHIGSTMQLVASTVGGREGENLVLDGKDGPDYSVHPAYLIPLVPLARIRPNQPVIAEWAGALRHGVAKRYAKDKVVVRFTDTTDRGERSIGRDRIMAQSEGLSPGNYAAQRVEGELEHVLLVSPINAEPKLATEWFILGYGGAARVVKTDQLVAIPISLEPKVGANVLAAHLGKMRQGVVKAIDRPGVMTVRFERAGRPIETGWGLVMPAGPGAAPVTK